MKTLAVAILSVACVAVLSACGGGGGDPGSGSYEITLRAERTQLPINIGNVGPGIGVSAPYTTTLYVQATDGGNPIPNAAKDAFACNTAYGLSSGPLYYLDGDPEHEHDVPVLGGTVKVPSAYRSVTLGANAGGASFHFHAGDQAGTATITCSVFDPSKKKNVATSINITVGAATGKAASVRTFAYSTVLGTQGNQGNLSTSVTIDAQVLDDASQPVADGAKPNLQIAIVSGGASAGARLLTGGPGNNVAWARTNNGVATFSLASGTEEGTILLELIADRFDGDVSNGIQEAIRQLVAVQVSAGSNTTTAIPLEFVDFAPPAAVNGLPYSYALSVKGGKAPYTWTALGGLPDGMTLNASGLLAGTPALQRPGDVQVAVRVTDSGGSSLTGNFTLTVVGTPPIDAETNPPFAISLAGCSADINGPACTLDVPIGGAYQYVLTTTGGTAALPTWSTEPTPLPLAWLTLSPQGILSGSVPVTCGPIGDPFFIIADQAPLRAMRKVQIRGVTGPGGSC